MLVIFLTRLRVLLIFFSLLKCKTKHNKVCTQSTLDVDEIKNSTPGVDGNTRLKQHVTFFGDALLCAEVCHDDSDVRADVIRMGVCLEWMFVLEGACVHTIRLLMNADGLHACSPDIDDCGIIFELIF